MVPEVVHLFHVSLRDVAALIVANYALPKTEFIAQAVIGVQREYSSLVPGTADATAAFFDVIFNSNLSLIFREKKIKAFFVNPCGPLVRQMFDRGCVKSCVFALSKARCSIVDRLPSHKRGGDIGMPP